MTLRPTLYTARWLLPVSEPPMHAGALLVNDAGRIERMAPRAAFELSSDVARVDFGDAVLLPGLVNVHSHPELAAFRGLLDDLPFHEWVPTLMRCKRGAQLTLDDYAVAARWTCIESLRSGITTVGATEDSGAAAGALTAAGMRGLVFLETFGPAPDQAEASLADLRTKVERAATQSSEHVRFGVSPHAPYTCSDALYAMVAAYAKAENLPVATHAAEAEAEELLVRNGQGPFAAGLRSRGIATAPRGRSTFEMLQRTGIMDCRPLLIHAVRASESDLRIIAESGATIAHCPVANARLGHGIAPIVEAIASGITVAIGTDSVASNNRLDMLEEARFAQAMQRARLQSASALPAADLLRMTTIEGARMLGRADDIGTLEKGKAADFCVVALDTAHAVPVADPLSALFQAARGTDVRVTAVAGRILYSDGCVHTLDENDLRTKVTAIAERLLAARNVT